MSEARLWQRAKEGLGPFFFLQRVENLVGEGVPDVILHCRKTGVCVFLELKYRPELPILGKTPVFKGAYGLRPAQTAWIYWRAKAGAKICVLGRSGDNLWLIPGNLALSLDKFTRDDLDREAIWRHAGRGPDWRRCAQLMLFSGS